MRPIEMAYILVYMWDFAMVNHWMVSFFSICAKNIWDVFSGKGVSDSCMNLLY